MAAHYGLVFFQRDQGGHASNLKATERGICCECDDVRNWQWCNRVAHHLQQHYKRQQQQCRREDEHLPYPYCLARRLSQQRRKDACSCFTHWPSGKCSKFEYLHRCTQTSDLAKTNKQAERPSCNRPAAATLAVATIASSEVWQNIATVCSSGR